MVVWWEWIAWMATVCFAVWFGSIVAGRDEGNGLSPVPARARARHDATGR
jgi:hypothetical protein